MADDHAWYQNTVIYGIDIRSFQDSDGDGSGDFRGLTSRLDYLAGLGVGTLWLLPFYVSPFLDNGYDVIDHCRVDPRTGSESDFDRLVEEAHRRDLRIVIELLANHTSDQHPWFQEARREPRSRYRDYYVWADSPPPPEERPDPIIPDSPTESVWTHDPRAGAWYFHRFRPYEPDLNTANPAVLGEVHAIMRHWLDRGVDGFRIDAISHVVERKHDLPKPLRSELLADLGDRAREVSSAAVLLMGEADVDLEELAGFFVNGRGMNVLLGFLIAENCFLALARESAEPLTTLIGALPTPPAGATWAQFLRNLDELDLERLTPDEREQVYRSFAPARDMRIYDRGIRRRVAPMLRGDRRRLEMAWSLLFGLPGVPLFAYGDEIGMGDDLSLDQRDAVRTPMQWDGSPGAGFSTAEPARLLRPVISGGQFGAQRINVESQLSDPDSLLGWFRRLIGVRRSLPQLALARPRLVDVGDARVLAVAYDGPASQSTVIVLTNLSPERLDVRVPGLHDARVLFADEGIVEVEERLSIGGFGYRWLELGGR